MGEVKRFEDLEVWKLSRLILKDFNRLIKSTELGFDKILVYQMRRAATSVIANIAEGFERNGNKEFCNFLFIAKGSSGEFRTLLYSAFDNESISEKQFNEFYSRSCQISGALFNLIKYLKSSSIEGIRYRKK